MNIQTAIWSSPLAIPIFPPALNPEAFSIIWLKASLVAPSTAPSYTWLSPTKLFLLALTNADSNTLGIEFNIFPPMFTAHDLIPKFPNSFSIPSLH